MSPPSLASHAPILLPRASPFSSTDRVVTLKTTSSGTAPPDPPSKGQKRAAPSKVQPKPSAKGSTKASAKKASAKKAPPAKKQKVVVTKPSAKGKAKGKGKKEEESEEEDDEVDEDDDEDDEELTIFTESKMENPEKNAKKGKLHEFSVYRKKQTARYRKHCEVCVCVCACVCVCVCVCVCM
jgi:hypothetical protein